jgi:hypothetical protein
LNKFERDLSILVNKLSDSESKHVAREIDRLKSDLVLLHKKHLVKINHSVMELICAKYLILSDYYVDVERNLDGLSCDIYASKGLGNMIVEVETGFVPPEHALDPLTYIKARIVSKITRYSNYAEKFCLAIPSHYILWIHQALVETPHNRTAKEIKEIKSLCDLYYSNPPIKNEEIINARIHTVYIVDVDNVEIRETEPAFFVEKTQTLFHNSFLSNPQSFL